MAGTNQFKAFATGGSAYTLTAADYAALTDFIANGFPSGIVDGAKFNTVLRQACMVAASLGKIVSDANLNAMDDGNVSALAANIYAALRASLVGQSTTITAGLGLDRGGDLSGNVTIDLGTPSTCQLGSVNSVNNSSHVHALDIPSANVSWRGLIQLAINSEALAGLSSTLAVTPATMQYVFTSLFGKRVFAENDYIRIPDVSGGLNIKWGKVTGVSFGAKTVTFPASFEHACLNVGATLINGGAENSITFVSCTAVTSGNATFYIDAQVGTVGFYWFAIGY